MQPVRTYAGFMSVISCFAALMLAQAAYAVTAEELAAVKERAAAMEKELAAQNEKELAAAKETVNKLTKNDEKAKEEKAAAERNKQEAFDKSKWGIGVSATYDKGKDRIVNAEVNNNIVRVSGDNNFVARLLLERHFFTKEYGECHMGDACGMFVAVQLGSTNSQFLDAVGAGYMWGWKPTSFSDSVSSFNLGVGLIADPNTKVLGDGITKNQPLPAGDTLRYRTTTKYGVLVLVSFGL